MDFTLQRIFVTQRTTIGVINWPDAAGTLKPLCFTCEDPVRLIKVARVTAIPAGQYEVIVSRSVRFGRDLPEILSVPDFSGVRIHPGNTAEDTEGCILPGTHAGIDEVQNSRIAFDQLFERIRAAVSHGPLLLNIFNLVGRRKTDATYPANT